MNTALKTTLGDLSRVLQKSLVSESFTKHLQGVTQKHADQIVAKNRNTHPELKSTVTQTGPLSYSIRFSAPGLWNSVFGTRTRNERGFETRITKEQGGAL